MGEFGGERKCVSEVYTVLYDQNCLKLNFKNK